MANKKIQIIPPDGGYVDVLHPETTASQVIEETNKRFMTDAERTKLATLSTSVVSQSDFNEHKAEKATQNEYGHIRLQDIPNPEIATQIEAEAGTNNTKMMTPLRTNQAIDNKFRWTYGSLEVNIDGVWRMFNERMPDDTTGSPGSEYLISGTMEEGFFGEVPTSELITGNALASECGISAGTSQNSTAGWLKFALDDKILFVAKKPIRHSISWDNINAADCVYGNKTVVIGGLTYKVRLMKGALTDPSLYDTADRGAIGSEWNRLMLPIHVEAPSSWAYPAYVASPTKDWGIDYTDTDLVTASAGGDGSYSWCQETRSSDTTRRVYRGNFGVSNSGSATSSSAPVASGWRPVLEVVI